MAWERGSFQWPGNEVHFSGLGTRLILGFLHIVSIKNWKSTERIKMKVNF